MTAAHCVRDESGKVANFVEITFGHSNVYSDEVLEIGVKAIKTHPKAFNISTKIWENDIALLQLSRVFERK